MLQVLVYNFLKWHVAFLQREIKEDLNLSLIHSLIILLGF